MLKSGNFFEHLGVIKWSFKHTECVRCGTTNHKHRTKGICNNCYDIIKKEKYEIKKQNKIKKEAESLLEKHTVNHYLKKIDERLKNGLPCMKIHINGDYRLLPFDTLEKPNPATGEKYNTWKAHQYIFEVLREYYNTL